MVDSLINPELEAQMRKIKDLLVEVQKIQTVFTNTFQTMKPRERAETARKIQKEHKEISEFIQNARKYDLRAPALKFGLENIKQKYQMIMTLWRRTERLLEEAAGTSLSHGRKPVGVENQNPTQQAVDDYAAALRNMGHSPTEAMIHEFRSRLDTAYNAAKEKSGAKDLQVKIIQEGGKIKVRMEPK